MPASLTGRVVTAIAAGGGHNLVIVATSPVVTAQPGSVTVAAGETATFTAAASNATSAQWQRAEPGSSVFADVSGATDTDDTTPVLTAADNGARYRAVFSNVAGSVSSDPATVTVFYPPGAPSITAVTGGSGAVTIAFTAGAAGNPTTTSFTATATPSGGGAAVTSADASGSPITISGLTDGTAYTITVTATNTVGSATSAPSSPVTPGVAPAISGTPPAGTVGAAYSFTYTRTGSPAPTITLTAGALPAGFTVNSAGVLSGTPTAAGMSTFTLTASNGINPAATVTSTVTIAGPANTPPVVAATFAACFSDTSATVSLAVYDGESAASQLTVTAPDDSSAITTGLAGSGSIRILQINTTGAAALSGTVTVTVKDPAGATTTLPIRLLRGTDTANTLTAPAAVSTIVLGRGGNDTITGADRSDLVCGGAGNDTVNSGAGNDAVYGGDGTDTLTGTDGDDLLSGGNGNDTLTGGNGNDILLGDHGNDQLTGGAGADVFTGGPDTDTYTDYTPSQGDTQY